MTIKAVIFDLDGTITQPYFDFDAIREEIGLTRDSGPVLESMEKMDPQQYEQAERVLNRHEHRAVEESKLNPGARETLSALRQAGIYIGVLTRNRKDNAVAIAQKHSLKFDAIVGREQGPAKPDAFGVLELCRQFAIEPAETMIVGDYLFDLLCARAAGAHATLLKNHHQADDFVQHADFCVENISEILQIIRDENGGQLARKVRNNESKHNC
jgi:HAD superfamily hydrolase (TIGR01509 family)